MTAWAGEVTPFDAPGGLAHRGCFAPGFGAGIGRLCVAGLSAAGADAALTSDDAGATWVDRGGLFPSTSIAAQGFCRGICFAPALGLVVAVGSDSGGSVGQANLSADGGATWAGEFSPFGANPMYGVASNPAGTLLVAIDSAGALWSSTNGTVWTSRTSPLTTGFSVKFLEGLDLWIACGAGSPEAIATAPAANVATWTPVPSLLDGGGAFDAAYQRAASKLYVGGFSILSLPIMQASGDGGATWGAESTPYDTTGEYLALAEAGATMLAAGDDGFFVNNYIIETDGSGVWTADATPADGPSDGEGVFYSPELGQAFLLGQAGSGGASFCIASAAFAPLPPPPVPTPSGFPGGKPWRFVVADLDCRTLTLLDSLAEQRRVVYTLNAPAQAQGTVPSDNPQVNLLVGGLSSIDSDPLVSYSDRILFGFRREGRPDSVDGPWIIRFAGLLMQLEDAAGSDDARSAYTAYDPWQYLFSRPIRSTLLALPGPEGLTFDGGDTTLDQIAYNFIANTIAADGFVYTDIDTGTIETIPFTGTINFQQGTSVGDALTQLCNTGLMDIWFSPVYDPALEPGIIARLNIFAQQGAPRYDSPMSWDSPPKSLVGISRLLDGVQLANNVQFYNGQGGPPVTLQSDAGSVAKYGEYWAQQFFPAQTKAAAVEDIAAMQLALRQIGRRTLTINPAPERAPDPFTGYFLGDLLPVYATKRLRQTLPAPQETTNFQRVYGIPIDISDNSVETVSQLLSSPDGFSP